MVPCCESTTTSVAQWKEGSSEPVKMAGMGLRPCREMQAVSGRLRFLPGGRLVCDRGMIRGEKGARLAG